MADETPKPGEHPLIAGVEGLVRGVVPFGLGDAFLQGALGGRDPAFMDEMAKGQIQRKQVNPGSALVGELGGTAAGLLIPGSQANLVGQAEGAASNLVGGGLAGSLASGVTGGSLYGLGSVINEATLVEPSTAAEKLAIIGGGGLAGGALNLITHGAGAAAEGALTKFAGSSTLKEMLDKVADRTAELALSSKKVTRASGLSGEESRSIFREFAPLFRTEDLGSMSKFGERVTAVKEQAGQEMGAALGKGQGFTFNPDRLEVRVEKNILDKMRKNPHLEGDVRRIEGILEGYKGRNLTLDDIHAIQSEIKSSIGYAESDATKSTLSRFRTELRDELIDQLHGVSQGAGREYTDAANKYRRLSALDDMADEMQLRAESNSPVALRDMGVAAMLLSHGNVAGLAGLAGSKFVRERGGLLATAALRRLAEGKTVPAIANAFKGKIDSLIESGLGGAFRNTLAELSAKGAEPLLAGHIMLAKADPNYLPALGLEHETPEASEQYAAKEAGLGHLRQQLGALDDIMDLAADRFAGKASGRPPTTSLTRMSRKDFADTYEQLQKIAQAPASVDTSKMAGVAPTVSMMLQQQAVKGAQFLLDKAPKSPNTGRLPALAVPWKPSESDIATWAKYVEGVTRPAKVVSDLGAGKVPAQETVEAIKAVYPKTYEDIRERMMARVADLKDPMSYNKKQALASLFGREILGEDPRVASIIQTTHAAARGGSGGAPQTDGRQTVSQAENMATQAQRIQTRGVGR